ncbi:MAG: response regulator transcription factor [Alphaproteobacteria bacterium]|nr:response regulator transcription factor [Alphaproteobacteria bacterium]
MIERRTRIILIEDDPDFADVIVEYLQYHGFDLTVCNQAVATLDLIGTADPDLILLDQFMDGDDMMRHLPRIRAIFGGPILFLSGNTDASDLVVGLEGGADDFIHKTAPPREILARIRTNLRRSGLVDDGAVAAPAEQLPVTPEHTDWEINRDGWIFNYQSRVLAAPDGNRVTTTPSERDLLWYMMQNMGKVLSREAIYAKQGMRRAAEDPGRTVDNLISRCRRTVRRIGGALILDTVRNRGYIWYRIEARADTDAAPGEDTGDTSAQTEPCA